MGFCFFEFVWLAFVFVRVCSRVLLFVSGLVGWVSGICFGGLFIAFRGFYWYLFVDAVGVLFVIVVLCCAVALCFCGFWVLLWWVLLRVFS